MSEAFYKALAGRLIGECETRKLLTSEQVTNYVTRALTIKYGNDHRLNIASLIADVFTTVNAGIRDFPDLPDDLKPPDLNSPAITKDVTLKATELATQYRSDGKRPGIDQIYSDAKISLGLMDDRGKMLRIANEEDQTKLAKITTVTASVMAGQAAPVFDKDVENGLAPIIDVVNEGLDALANED